ncbi:MAG: PhoU domain-containing protein [Nitrososphaerales archaeon]
MVEIKEETRKIQYTGKSSYIVSLPKKWVEGIGLRPGDRVSVIRQGSSLLQIGPLEKQFIKKGVREAIIEAGINDHVNVLIRKLIALYILGFNVISVRAKDGRLQTYQREGVKDVVRKVLMGSEITADSTDGVTIQVLINIVDLSVDAAFKRMLLLAKSMLKDAMLALQESNNELAKEVIKSDDEVDRFSFYIIRQLDIAILDEYLLTDMGLKPQDCLGYRVVVKSLERTADHAANIAEDVLEIQEPIEKHIIARIINMSNFALEVLDDACLSLFKKDYTEAERAIEKLKKIDGLERQVIKDSHNTLSNVSEMYRVKFITDNLRRIAEYASDIAEIVLNMTVEQTVKRSKA